MNRNMLTVIATSLALSTIISTSAVSAAEVNRGQVSIAAVMKEAAKASNLSIRVDGVSSNIRTLNVKGTVLYSVRDIANIFGADIQAESKSVITLVGGNPAQTITVRVNSGAYEVDGATKNFSVAPLEQKGVIYAELNALVEALGGEVSGSGSKLDVVSVKPLEGDFSSPRVNSNGEVIAARESDGTVQLYKWNPTYWVYDALTSNENAASTAVSPDLKWGVFTDESSQLYLLDLSLGTAQAIGKDTSVKTDLTWSADGKKVYFVQGDKQEKIAYVSVDSGKITSVLADKVENKSDIRLSADDKTVLYAVNITGVAKNDKDSTEDSLSIDFSGAGSQLFTLDLTAKDAKPVQLTTTSDNKLYPNFLADGRAVYVSGDTEGKVENSVLKVVQAKEKKVSDLVADLDVSLAVTSAKGQLIIVATEKDGKSSIYAVKEDGSKSKLYTNDGAITEVFPSADGSQIAVIENGQVKLVANNQAVALTK
ncbi:stalk domain-containing protein [Paenibacillus alvei]|uniref:Copper amine oxidase-like N-terminal domain-containing protein n=1 Tax=Paenibacillus alvei TaxID=44250 RepID=A0A383RIG4_PAEAL|nr:stalk domain-containing protein [Paenibacillus alvei]SYX86096.1 conserved exported protein of unknown function [Paenibacillus alvei]